KSARFFDQPNPVVFIDEIHRFNKSQQDSLLGAVEQGIITLIGATTENPSFEVIPPLLSRCQVFILKPLDDEVLRLMISGALKKDLHLRKYRITIAGDEALVRVAAGDARKLYNALELSVAMELKEAGEDGEVVITDEKVLNHIQNNLVLYDKNGEMHYDIISAFIKSIRGSDPNAAVYYLARMVEGGEDVRFIARRLIILAAEDIGLANPNALMLAQSAFEAVNVTGWPESRIILSEIAIYLALSPKSNSAYMAINNGQGLVKETGNLPLPLHLRNAPTKLMKEQGYGKDYQYAHNYDNNFIYENYLPREIEGRVLYNPGKNNREDEFRSRLRDIWKDKYGY
ncbi:MAG: replication-associated recombination protein A, partial [Bacteroidetes bacterium]|nr:replication-associated recombination protein A [Bacteroidota bacterium]